MKCYLQTFVIFLILSTSGVMASDTCSMGQVLSPEIQKIMEQLNLEAPTDEEIRNAACKTQTLPTIEEMEKFIKLKTDGKEKSESINGVSFNGESEKRLKIFEDLTTSTDVFFRSLTHEKQSVFEISSECKKVICAVEKIWGKELGTKLLYLRVKYGFNGSEFAFSDETEKIVRLKNEDLDDILMAMGDVPEPYHGISVDQPLVHFHMPKKQAPSRIASAQILLFDKWFMQSSPMRQYSIYHEMSHNIAGKLNLDHSPAWLALSGWKSKQSSWEYDSEKSCFSSKYATTDPGEDFAESMSAYRYNPKKFKDFCPKKYAFLKKNVYKGREYLNSNCR